VPPETRSWARRSLPGPLPAGEEPPGVLPAGPGRAWGRVGPAGPKRAVARWRGLPEPREPGDPPGRGFIGDPSGPSASGLIIPRRPDAPPLAALVLPGPRAPTGCPIVVNASSPAAWSPCVPCRHSPAFRGAPVQRRRCPPLRRPAVAPLGLPLGLPSALKLGRGDGGGLLGDPMGTRSVLHQGLAVWSAAGRAATAVMNSTQPSRLAWTSSLETRTTRQARDIRESSLRRSMAFWAVRR
jgi:hypothetical protein